MPEAVVGPSASCACQCRSVDADTPSRRIYTWASVVARLFVDSFALPGRLITMLYFSALLALMVFQHELPLNRVCDVAGWKKTCQVASRLYGRLLGSFITEGMTKDQVERIFHDQPFDMATTSAGDGATGCIVFRSVGVTISVSTKPGHIGLMVTEVSYLNLWQDESRKEADVEAEVLSALESKIRYCPSFALQVDLI